MEGFRGTSTYALFLQNDAVLSDLIYFNLQFLSCFRLLKHVHIRDSLLVHMTHEFEVKKLSPC